MPRYTCSQDCEFQKRVYKYGLHYEFPTGTTPPAAFFDADASDTGEDDSEKIVNTYDGSATDLSVELDDTGKAGFYSNGLGTAVSIAVNSFEGYNFSASRFKSAYSISLPNGIVTAPAIQFTGMTNGGLYRDSGNNSLRMAIEGVDSMCWEDGGDICIDGKLYPITDDTHDLGDATHRFDDVYATNATIQTSDGALKEAIEDTMLGADFLEHLRPVEFKWKNTSEVKEEVTEQVQKTEEIKIEQSTVEMVDGKAVLKTVVKIENRPLYEDVPVHDEEGKVIEGMTHKVPVMEEQTYDKVKAPALTKPFIRTHYGLIAQEVETALSALGIKTADFAPLIIDEPTGRYGIRYGELVPILIKAVQEHSLEIEALKEALNIK